MSRTIIDVHVLQSVPPSNLNRDDTGSPKTAAYGGVRRARVSSQAWKRATRKLFSDYLDTSEMGVRTKRVVELVSAEIRATHTDINPADAVAAAEAVLTAAKIALKAPKARKNQDSSAALKEAGYLVFLSALQIKALAALGAEAFLSNEKPDSKLAVEFAKTGQSIDLALFGRMIADTTDLNVDASCQVAHALSTHAVETEYDYFTAVDDHKAASVADDAGAGMIGTVEFNSATLYRYATIDVDRLAENLGDITATQRAVSAFIRAFVLSMPTGKLNTFANQTLPDAVLITLRKDRSVSLVGAFENPISDNSEGGRMAASIKALATYADNLQKAYNMPPVDSWTIGIGSAADKLSPSPERVSLDEAISALSVEVGERLGNASSPS